MEEALATLMLDAEQAEGVKVVAVPDGRCNLQDLQRTASNEDGTLTFVL